MKLTGAYLTVAMQFLVVRREWSQHPQIQQLLEHLYLGMKQRHQQGTAPEAKPIEDLQVESYC